MRITCRLDYLTNGGPYHAYRRVLSDPYIVGKPRGQAAHLRASLELDHTTIYRNVALSTRHCLKRTKINLMKKRLPKYRLICRNPQFDKS